MSRSQLKIPLRKTLLSTLRSLVLAIIKKNIQKHTEERNLKVTKAGRKAAKRIKHKMQSMQ